MTRSPGCRNITEAVHQEGCPIFVQLHHAGLVSIGTDTLCPSDYAMDTNKGWKNGHEMTRDDIHRIRDAIHSGCGSGGKGGL